MSNVTDLFGFVNEENDEVAGPEIEAINSDEGRTVVFKMNKATTFGIFRAKGADDTVEIDALGEDEKFTRIKIAREAVKFIDVRQVVMSYPKEVADLTAKMLSMFRKETQSTMVKPKLPFLTKDGAMYTGEFSLMPVEARIITKYAKDAITVEEDEKCFLFRKRKATQRGADQFYTMGLTLRTSEIPA